MAFSINNIPIGSNGAFSSIIGKPRRSTFGASMMIVLLVIGFVFVALSSMFVLPIINRSNWPATSGTVTSVRQSYDQEDNQTMYSPVVGYTIDGKQYTAVSSSYSSFSPSVGSAMEVRYNPSNPGDASIVSGSDWIVFIFPVVGTVLIIAAPIAYIRSKRRTDAIQNLKTTGTKITGIVTGMQNVGSQGDDTNRQPVTKVVITANDPVSGHPNQYVSDSVVGNMFGLVGYETTPVAVDVYVDPSNTDNYYVDLDDLPSFDPGKLTELVAQKLTGVTSTVPSAQPASQPTVATQPQVNPMTSSVAATPPVAANPAIPSVPPFTLPK